MSNNGSKRTVDAIKYVVKELGHAVVDRVGKAADWMKDQTDDYTPLGFANLNDIAPGMEVFSSCGRLVGTVDHFEDGAIKLTREESPDHRHHFIPSLWVAKVDDHVHLNKNANETWQEWKPDSASCFSASPI